ncbi:hypothetical protein C7974DRAFT_194116 [Boeremia exigua]|uniref:uncharacterized protein n=1 Tax=Boeremia exigua TaxID=749465 RepID=UPI001E8EE900|nr:uncharacterized protein C7974DRAFT_194116 [Boeremia exigua]KAH6629828.1 hypothetical protein C7974DRAFT_194116 [Boeremia exigua]
MAGDEFNNHDRKRMISLAVTDLTIFTVLRPVFAAAVACGGVRERAERLCRRADAASTVRRRRAVAVAELQWRGWKDWQTYRICVVGAARMVQCRISVRGGDVHIAVIWARRYLTDSTRSMASASALAGTVWKVYPLLRRTADAAEQPFI